MLELAGLVLVAMGSLVGALETGEPRPTRRCGGPEPTVIRCWWCRGSASPTGAAGHQGCSPRGHRWAVELPTPVWLEACHRMSKTSSTSPPSTTDTGSMTGLAALNEPVLPTCGMPRRFRGLDVCACAKAVSFRGSGACFRRSQAPDLPPPKRKVAGSTPAWGTKFFAFPQVSGGVVGHMLLGLGASRVVLRPFAAAAQQSRLALAPWAGCLARP
jgi:hypothetical protein